MGCSSGSGRGCRGGICLRCMGTGRPCTTGIVAGRGMGRGRRSWRRCRPAATSPRAGTGRWPSIPRWSGPTSTPPVPATSRRRTSIPTGWPRPCWAPRVTRGADANHKKTVGLPGDTSAKTGASVKDRETLGRSRGGLTSKIHLGADSHCRMLARVTSAGQRHDSLGYAPVIDRIRVRRKGRGRPRTCPGQVLADKAYSSKAIRADLRRRGITATIPEPADQIRNRKKRGSHSGRRPAFDKDASSSATPSNAPSTNCANTAPWPPATTNATSSGAEPLTSQRSGSGSETQLHDLRDTP